ncbi:hypothetical protein ACFOWX_03615 [Sphingorhabdus arenilitoris]|uniref:Uncharacterized protein n=1 Tax=Sphingorhabdus arenilitoris TaxID=1490041 RepID=A0ABV8RDM2_9SPHN
MTNYIFQRGETISLALDALSGDSLSVSSISAVMKAVAPGRTSAAPGAPVAAAFAIEPRMAGDDNPAGWTLTVPAMVSADLPPGSYIADARLELTDGKVVVSDSITMSIRPSVSA